MSAADDKFRWCAVHSAIVTNNKDPEGRGRVKVKLPAAAVEAWARLATPMAGRTRGSFFIPEVEDEVLVAFEAGDPRRPYVLGALWSSDRPDGNEVAVDDGPGSIEIKDGQGNSIRLEPAGVTVTAGGKVTINASTVEVSASMLTVNAGMSRFSGVVQAETLIATSVIAASYSPGAGNVV
jgi:Type VI secretion system/phage-baseplate injector OB domain